MTAQASHHTHRTHMTRHGRVRNRAFLPDFRAITAVRSSSGAAPLGTNLRGNLPDGQNSAGISVGNNTLFSVYIVKCNVSVPCGSTLPASHMHLLFRTPSFRGQACVPHIVLSAFFFARDLGKNRQKTAHTYCSQQHLLRDARLSRHLAPKQSITSKGQSTCKSNEPFSYYRLARVLRPVVTPRASRPCLAVAQGRLEPRSSAQTRFSAQRSVQPATCCIARHRTPVTNARVSGARYAPTVIAYHAITGCLPGGGVLRFPYSKTKDVPCSTRS